MCMYGNMYGPIIVMDLIPVSASILRTENRFIARFRFRFGSSFR